MSVLSWVMAYLLGSISFSYLIAKKIARIDIREHGSGNAGATNTLRVLGKGPAILVLALDIFKGMAAVGVGYWFSGGDTEVTLVAGALAIIGHNWPIYFRFKGGKGIATTIGVMATVAFFPALYAGIIAILSIVLTRYVSLGSLIFVSGTPIMMLWTGESFSHIIFALFVAILGITRHYKNLINLIKGKERKIGEPSPPAHSQQQRSE
ncbi:MAG: glycerol-3-phosphate 1-O-acyltransferase PlsY [Bacillaceae bacterium]|nr:glycerol-3-phosphate 1-O-acyltransferase PlsY [Bacillaceae bacterium]